MSEHGYELAVGFDTDAPEFVRGFEAGRIYTELRDCPDAGYCRHDLTVHGTNLEMMLRLAEATDHQIVGHVVDLAGNDAASDADLVTVRFGRG